MSRAGCCNTIITTKGFSNSEELWKSNFNSDTTCIGPLYDETDSSSGLVVAGRHLFSQKRVSSEFEIYTGTSIELEPLNDYENQWMNRAYIVGEDLENLTLNGDSIRSAVYNLTHSGQYANIAISSESTLSNPYKFAVILATGQELVFNASISGNIENIGSSYSTIYSGVLDMESTLLDGSPYQIALTYGGGYTNVINTNSNLYAIYSEDGDLLEDTYYSGLQPSIYPNSCFGIKNDDGLHIFLSDDNYLVRIKNNLVDGVVYLGSNNSFEALYDNDIKKIWIKSSYYPNGLNINKDQSGIPIKYTTYTNSGTVLSDTNYDYTSVDAINYYNQVRDTFTSLVNDGFVNQTQSLMWSSGDVLRLPDGVYIDIDGVRTSQSGQYIDSYTYTMSGYNGLEHEFARPFQRYYDRFSLLSKRRNSVNSLYKIDPFTLEVEQTIELPDYDPQYAIDNSPTNGILSSPAEWYDNNTNRTVRGLGFVEDSTKVNYTQYLNDHINPQYEYGEMLSGEVTTYHKDFVVQNVYYGDFGAYIINASENNNRTYDAVGNTSWLRIPRYQVELDDDAVNRHIKSNLKFVKSIGNVSTGINSIHKNRDRIYVTYTNSYDIFYTSWKFACHTNKYAMGLGDDSDVQDSDMHPEFYYDSNIDQSYVHNIVLDAQNEIYDGLSISLSECISAGFTAESTSYSINGFPYANKLGIYGINSVTNRRYSEHEIGYGTVSTDANEIDIFFLEFYIEVPGARLEDTTDNYVHTAYLWEEPSTSSTYKIKHRYVEYLGGSPYANLSDPNYIYTSDFTWGVCESEFLVSDYGSPFTGSGIHACNLYLNSSTVPGYSPSQQVKVRTIGTPTDAYAGNPNVAETHILDTMSAPYVLTVGKSNNAIPGLYVENQQYLNISFDGYVPVNPAGCLIINADGEVNQDLGKEYIIQLPDTQGGYSGGIRTYLGSADELVNSYTIGYVNWTPSSQLYLAGIYPIINSFSNQVAFDIHPNAWLLYPYAQQSLLRVPTDSTLPFADISFIETNASKFNTITFTDNIADYFLHHADGSVDISTPSNASTIYTYGLWSMSEYQSIRYTTNPYGTLYHSSEFGVGLKKELMRVNGFSFIELSNSFSSNVSAIIGPNNSTYGYIEEIPAAQSLMSLCPWLIYTRINTGWGWTCSITKTPVIDTIIKVNEERVAIYDIEGSLISDESISDKYDVEYPKFLPVDDAIIPRFEVTQVSNTTEVRRGSYTVGTNQIFIPNVYEELEIVPKYNWSTYGYVIFGINTNSYYNSIIWRNSLDRDITSITYNVNRLKGIIPPLYGGPISDISDLELARYIDIYNIGSINNYYSFSVNGINGFFFLDQLFLSKTRAISESTCYVDFTNALQTINSSLDWDDNFDGWYVYNYYLNGGFSYAYRNYTNRWYRLPLESSYGSQFRSFLKNTDNKYYPSDYLLRARDDDTAIISKEITKWIPSYSDANLDNESRVDVNYYSTGCFLLPEESFSNTDIPIDLCLRLNYISDEMINSEYIEGVISPFTDNIKAMSFDNGVTFNYLAEIYTTNQSGLFYPYVNSVPDSGSAFIYPFNSSDFSQPSGYRDWIYKVFRIKQEHELFKYDFHTVDQNAIKSDITDYIVTKKGYQYLRGLECNIDKRQFGQISITMTNSGFFDYTNYDRTFTNLNNTGGFLFPQTVDFGVEHYPSDGEFYDSIPSAYRISNDIENIEFYQKHYSDLNDDDVYELDYNNGEQAFVYSDPIDIYMNGDKTFITGKVMLDANITEKSSASEDFDTHYSHSSDFVLTESDYEAKS